jgi:cytidylate kinase
MAEDVRRLRIAIDGPAGAGKSTVARALAGRLALKYLDTGAMYRAITLKVYRNNVDLEDTTSMQALLDTTSITINNGKDIILDGEDVSEEIRMAHVNRLVSPVSCLSMVRRRLVGLQQEIASSTPRIVMEGRDIASRVMPDAEYKFYLDASLEERAKRRFKEQLEKGISIALEEVVKDIAGRDVIDSNREDSPLTRVEDAIVIDTTGLSIEQVIESLVERVDEKLR